jgi:hypothetical protein
MADLLHWQAYVAGLDNVDLLRALLALEAEALRRRLIDTKDAPRGAPV